MIAIESILRGVRGYFNKHSNSTNSAHLRRWLTCLERMFSRWKFIHDTYWDTWDNDLCSDFNHMTLHSLSCLISAEKAPEYSVLIATMTTHQGDLGIQHPRSTVILTYFSTMKQNIQYATEGILTNNHTPIIIFLNHLQSLYRNWEHNTSSPRVEDQRKGPKLAGSRAIVRSNSWK